MFDTSCTACYFSARLTQYKTCFMLIIKPFVIHSLLNEVAF